MLCVRRGAAFVAFALVWASAGALRAEELHVAVADDACPNDGQLEQALAPLLEEDVVLVFEATPSTTRRASVSDDGEQYAIEIDGERRELSDLRRDCVERARVAAVFIALNMRAPAPEPKPEPEPEPEPEEPEQPEPPPLPPGFGALAFGLAEHSTDADRTAFGGGAGVFYVVAPFRFELSAAITAPLELELTPSADVRGRVELMRVPLALTASYLLRLGAVELGPAVGLALDVLHIEGQGVERPQTELRLGAGILLAAEAHLWLTPRIGLLTRAQMRAFPKAYRLAVDPEGTLGETPRVWLSGLLGVEARF